MKRLPIFAERCFGSPRRYPSTWHLNGWIHGALSSLSLLNEKQNGGSLILLFRFIVFMFFTDSPKLGLDFSETTSNSRLSTMACTGLTLYETQKGEKRLFFPLNVVDFCFSNLLFSLDCQMKYSEQTLTGSGSRAGVHCLKAELNCNTARSCQDG